MERAFKYFTDSIAHFAARVLRAQRNVRIRVYYARNVSATSAW